MLAFINKSRLHGKKQYNPFLSQIGQKKAPDPSSAKDEKCIVGSNNMCSMTNTFMYMKGLYFFFAMLAGAVELI